MKQVFASALMALVLSATAASAVKAGDQSTESDAQRVRIELGVRGGYQYLLERTSPKNPYLSSVTYEYLLLYGDQLFDASPAGQAAESEVESSLLARISGQASATDAGPKVYPASTTVNTRSDLASRNGGDTFSTPAN